MSEAIVLKTPLTDEDVERLKTGDRVLINGVIYTARDAAHKRMIELLDSGRELPFDIRGQVIYYAGPAPAKPGAVIGSCGPTTSYRMDVYTPKLIQRGLNIFPDGTTIGSHYHTAAHGGVVGQFGFEHQLVVPVGVIFGSRR